VDSLGQLGFLRALDLHLFLHASDLFRDQTFLGFGDLELAGQALLFGQHQLVCSGPGARAAAAGPLLARLVCEAPPASRRASPGNQRFGRAGLQLVGQGVDIGLGRWQTAAGDWSVAAQAALFAGLSVAVPAGTSALVDLSVAAPGGMSATCSSRSRNSSCCWRQSRASFARSRSSRSRPFALLSSASRITGRQVLPVRADWSQMVVLTCRGTPSLVVLFEYRPWRTPARLTAGNRR